MGGYSGVDNLEVMAEARRYNAYLARLIERHAPADGTLVDFGAGAGTFATDLTAKGRRVVAVEPDEGLRTRLTEAGLEAHAGMDALPEGGIDFIYSLNVLEHIADDQAAARSLWRALKSDGRCLIYVPAFQVLYSSMDRKVGHVRRYTKAGLTGVLVEAGFDVETAAYADSLGFFASLVFKWLGSDDGSIDRRSLVIYDRFVFPLSRALDALVSGLFGKNVYAVAVKRR